MNFPRHKNLRTILESIPTELGRKIFRLFQLIWEPDMGKSGHESRLGHDFLTLKRLQKSRDQVVTRDHFAHV